LPCLLELLEARQLLAVNVALNANDRHQTIDGFGTSMAWWVPNLYEQEAWRNTFYQDLGSSILRADLNILALAGSDNNLATPVTMVEDLQTNINQFDWNAVPVARYGGVAQAAQSKKLDDFKMIGSIWTPPHWMKGVEKNPSTGESTGVQPVIAQVGDYLNSIGGSLIDSASNLQQFGRYVAAYVKGFEQHFGVPMYAISVQNELAFHVGYNSSVYDPSLYVKALKAVANAFTHYGISTKIMGPEDVGVGDVSDPYILKRQFEYINAIRNDPEAMEALDIYAIHGYANDGITTSRSAPMWSQYWNGRNVTPTWTGIKNDGKPSWMTEISGEPTTWEGALRLAGSVTDALVQSDVSAWVYWQMSEGTTPTASALTAGADTTAVKYTAAKHFFRYIRPGAVRVGATPSDPAGVYVSSFVRDADHTLTTVLVNEGTTNQTVNLSLSGITVPSFTLARQSTSSAQWVDLGAINTSNNTASINLPAGAIITLQGSTVGAPAQTPFKGSPFAIGAGSTTIQTEDFDNGGEGVAYHDLEPANIGGKYRTNEGVDLESAGSGAVGANVGFGKAGEWLEYTANVASGGAYTFSANVAAAADNGKFHLEVDGVDVTGSLTIPNTGGWQSWRPLSKSGINLAAGSHILRLVMDANGTSGYVGNIDSFTFTAVPIQPPPGAQTPFGSTPNLSSGSATTIEVEDFDDGGEGAAFHDADPANNGGAYRQTPVDIQTLSGDTSPYNVGWTQAGEWLEYTFTADAGTYDLAFRVASNGAGGTFHAEIDGANVTGSLAVPNTGGWQNWTTVSKSAVSVSAGTHVLRLAMDSVGATGAVGNFNFIKFVSIVAPPAGQKPYGGMPVAISKNSPATIELENFDQGGEGVAFHDTEAGNNGGQYRVGDGVDIESVSGDTGAYNVGWATAGEWLEYTVNVAEAGSYNVDFRIASNGAGGAFHLEVDGADVTGSITVPNTGAWQNWKTITKSVNLPAGQHVLRLAMDTVGSTGAVGNFNYMKLSGSTVTPPPTGSTPFSGTPVTINTGSVATVQAEHFDNGGEGVAYHDLDNTNQGNQFRSTGVDIESVSGDSGSYNIGYARAGEWLKYSVNVLTGGTYTLDFRVASAASGGKFHLEVDGADVTGQLALNSTGGWQSWQTLSKTGVTLTAGQHVLRLVMDAENPSGYVGNFNSIAIR
jgi:O-glycosyl hydrolase